MIEDQGSQFGEKSKDPNHSKITSFKTRNYQNPPLNYEAKSQTWVDIGEEEIYVDMRGSTPNTHRRANSFTSSNPLPVTSHTSNAERVDAPIPLTESMPTNKLYFDKDRSEFAAIRSPSNSYSSHDQDDYADMSGVITHSRNQSPIQSARRPRTIKTRSPGRYNETSQAKITGKNTFSKQILSAQRSRSQSNIVQESSTVTPTFAISANLDKNVLSPRKITVSANIMEGGFNKDDDDDYTDYQTMSSNEQVFHKTIIEPQITTLKTPNLNSRPSSTKNVFHSTSLTSLSNQVTIPSKRFGFSDSSEDEETACQVQRTKKNESKFTYRSKSVNDCKLTKLSTSSQEDILYKQETTEAGRAARKYLQHSDTRLSPIKGDIKRSPSIGISRSTSRAGKKGGVITRITKIRQNNSPKNLTFDGDFINHSKPDMEQTEQMLESNICDPIISAKYQRQQTNTLDRAVLVNYNAESKLTDSDTTLVNRQPLDGSLIMKFLASDSHSQTLDKKYIEWLAKTSPYASRHSSTSGKPDSSLGNCQPPTDTKSLENTSDDECDNISFTKFTKGVTNNYRLRFASESTPEPIISQNKALSLSQYAEKHSKVIETKSPHFTEKSRDNVEKDIKALKTAMTLKPIPRSENVEFSDLAEAFYKDYKKDIQKKTKKDSKKADKKSKDKKSISLRRSFRFGSKKKLSDSPSDLSLNLEPIDVSRDCSENTLDMSTESVGTSNLKPPIGTSNSIKKDSISRERSSSSSCHETRHSAREILNKVQTLEKGSAFSNSLASPDITFRGGSLRRDDPVYQSNLRNSTSISKSSTLGRLFSKKVKERRGLDVTDSSSNLFKPNGLQLENLTTNAKKDTTEKNRVVYDNLTQSQRYLRLGNLYRGIVMNVNDEKEEAHGTDILLSSLKRHSLSKSPPINKYATITGSYFHQTTTSSIKHNSLARHLSSDPIINTPKDEATRENRRNKKNRSSLKGLSLTFSGNLPKIEGISPVSKTEGPDATNKDKTEKDPLRSRQRQKVYPLNTEAKPRLLATARLIYQHLLKTQPNLLRNHNAQEESGADLLTFGNIIHEHCAFGHELVSWLLSRTQPRQQMKEDRKLSTSVTAAKLRWHTCGMWQVLQEEGLINHVSHERYFEDSSYLYQFHYDVTSYMRQDNDDLLNKHDAASARSSVDSGISQQVNGELISEDCEPNSRSSSIASSSRMITGEMSQLMLNDIDLTEEITYLQQNAQDALFRFALRKRTEDRSSEELMMIYEEILHINALAHLSDSIKRELAGVLQFEHHQDSGITLFKQGDEGTSWYIVLRGSVDVVIYGKGVVNTLREGDDFGNLAIVNDAPRTASILLAEKNCQFLRVDKYDFVRILKDVEANTVRLKEHGSDVLILQKIPARSDTSPRCDATVTSSDRFAGAATPTRQNHRYSISAGTPEKILEHILEYLQPWNIGRREEYLEDFIILHPVFISTSKLCELLINHYRSENVEHVECTRSIKRKIMYFTVRWSHIATYIFKSDPAVQIYVKDLKNELQLDMLANPSYCVLKEDINCLFLGNETDDYSNENPAQTLMRVGESLQLFSPLAPHEQTLHPVKANDQILLKVYNLQKTYTTVMISISANVEQIVQAVAEKLNRPSNDLILVELQEDGETCVITKAQTSIATSLKVNSRLFICTPEEKSSLSSFCFSNPNVSSLHFEMVSSLEVAYHVTKYDWELLTNVHVMEFVYKVFGAHKYNGLTSNLDIFTRRFNQLAYWAPTEICSCSNINKRVQLLRKFIKIAQHLKMYQNLNGFMAIMIGIGNQAVSRLSITWEKLPNKYKKLVQEYESLLDPSRNHRSYRIYVAALQAPVILYLPLLLKDMTFQHEGNDSNKNGLVNFEKMRMIGSSIRTVIQGCAKGIDVDSILETSKTGVETRNFVRKPHVITDQKLLNAMSNQLEPRR